MKRVAIIGSGGAGKSTLARQLGARLGLPVVHLDALFWRPGWVETPREEWVALQRELVAREAWVVDGNYNATLDIRLEAADTIVFLDLPNWVCAWRAVRRRVQHHGRTRPDLAPGCPEQIDLAFLRWIWDYPRTRRPGVLEKLERAAAEGKRVVRLRSNAEVERFLRELEPTPSA